MDRVFDDLYEKGLAVGMPEIRTDGVFFRYRDEKFEFPSSILNEKHGGRNIVRYDGLLYLASVKKLRALAKKEKHG